jgi:glucose-1-phosphate thymidylyltransferase
VKGIVLAGGAGTRLWPLTKAVNKHLLPIFDKPMIYHPLSTLMLAGIREITLISTPRDLPAFQWLLGDGDALGIDLTYEVQNEPRGLADAFIITQQKLQGNSICLILGDNIFYGSSLGGQLAAFKNPGGAQIFAYRVANPSNFGVVEMIGDDVVSIEEKPDKPKSNYAIPGLYFFNQDVFEIASEVKPSLRGEIEITSIISEYQRRSRLKVEVLPRGTAWLDTGTFEGLHDASSFIKTIEERQGMKVACLEEIALGNGWMNKEKIMQSALGYNRSSYRDYLEHLASN